MVVVEEREEVDSLAASGVEVDIGSEGLGGGIDNS